MSDTIEWINQRIAEAERGWMEQYHRYGAQALHPSVRTLLGIREIPCGGCHGRGSLFTEPTNLTRIQFSGTVET